MVINKLFRPEGAIFIDTKSIEQLLNRTSLDQFYSVKILNNTN